MEHRPQTTLLHLQLSSVLQPSSSTSLLLVSCCPHLLLQVCFCSCYFVVLFLWSYGIHCSACLTMLSLDRLKSVPKPSPLSSSYLVPALNPALFFSDSLVTDDACPLYIIIIRKHLLMDGGLYTCIHFHLYMVIGESKLKILLWDGKSFFWTELSPSIMVCVCVCV